MKSTTQLEVLF